MSSYTLNRTQRNLIEHLNQVIPNCPTAAASVPHHSQSPSLSLLSPSPFTSLLLLFPIFFLLPPSFPPHATAFSISNQSSVSSNIAPFFITSYENKGNQSLSSPAFLSSYTFLLHLLLKAPVITVSPSFKLFFPSHRLIS